MCLSDSYSCTTKLPVAKSFKSQNRLLQKRNSFILLLLFYFSSTVSSLPHVDNVKTTTSATQQKQTENKLILGRTHVKKKNLFMLSKGDSCIFNTQVKANKPRTTRCTTKHYNTIATTISSLKSEIY